MNAPAQAQLLEALRGRKMTRAELVAATGRAPAVVGRLMWKLSKRKVVRCSGVGRYSLWCHAGEAP